MLTGTGMKRIEETKGRGARREERKGRKGAMLRKCNNKMNEETEKLEKNNVRLTLYCVDILTFLISNIAFFCFIHSLKKNLKKKNIVDAQMKENITNATTRPMIVMK